ncbi:cytochrome P450 [Nemania sp. NC0429]|nr:cytochrome P450 [Nemania sp. NC0429]
MDKNSTQAALSRVFSGDNIRLLVVTSLVCWIGYVICLGIYRLYLSPIAHFPGPRLAALTGWYEAYFDLAEKGGGQFPFEIRRMHEKYGPIVRINPDELHVDDPEYYDVLYSTNKAYDKLERLQHRFSIPDATFSTVRSEDHKIRRSALAPFFSKTRVREQAGSVQGLMDAISDKLSTEYSGQNKPVNIMDVWSALSADAIVSIVFDKPMDFYKFPDFRSPFTIAVNSVAIYCHITLHFGFFLTIINNLPDWLAMRVFPPFRPVIEFRWVMEKQIADVLANQQAGTKPSSGRKTVFSEMVASDIPRSELRPGRLLQEAQSLVGAGFETTAWTLTIGTFHILDNPSVLSRLKSELEEAMPDARNILPLLELEKLPYLSAVSKEVLRIAFGGVERLPRINRTGTMTYKQWTIPPGTPVSMDQYHMHTNTQVFPEPDVFRPERWLGDAKGPDGVKPLTNYLTTFGRGTRMCLGLNLAHAEIYIGLATLFRRHELELFETTRRDVEFHTEYLKAAPWPGSKGVRVTVK